MADPKDFLAAERTLLAWLRTGIALMGFGFVVARFGLFLRELAHMGGHVPVRLDSALVGTVVTGAGVLVNVWASVRHLTIVRRLREGAGEIGAVGPMAIGVATGIGGVIVMGILLGSVWQ